jgi:hypothetical protein
MDLECQGYGNSAEMLNKLLTIMGQIQIFVELNKQALQTECQWRGMFRNRERFIH